MIYTTQRRRFVYDTWDNGNWLDGVMVECTLSITHCLQLNFQLHTIDLVRTCRICSFCTVAWQLARFQLTRRIARSLGDSWASCIIRCSCRSFFVLQVAEAELGNQVARLEDRCAKLDTSLHEANSKTEELRVKLLDCQPLQFASDANQPLLQSLKQRITANKVWRIGLYMFSVNLFCHILFLLC